jgi:hypothetical protein
MIILLPRKSIELRAYLVIYSGLLTSLKVMTHLALPTCDRLRSTYTEFEHQKGLLQRARRSFRLTGIRATPNLTSPLTLTAHLG